MTYYVGLSGWEYITITGGNSSKQRELYYITCIDSKSFEDPTSAKRLAIESAKQRGRKHQFEPVVVEITKPQEFEITPARNSVLRGSLNQDNHVVHSVDSLL